MLVYSPRLYIHHEPSMVIAFHLRNKHRTFKRPIIVLNNVWINVSRFHTFYGSTNVDMLKKSAVPSQQT